MHFHVIIHLWQFFFHIFRDDERFERRFRRTIQSAEAKSNVCSILRQVVRANQSTFDKAIILKTLPQFLI